jgi:hypothetical protein
VGHYGGGLHWSEVHEQDRIPFQKVRGTLLHDTQKTNNVDHLRDNGHVRTNRLPNESLSTLDHDPRV